jgi:hypothetical protein
MSKYDLYIGSFLTGTILILLGSFYHIQHLPGSGDILATGLLISLYWFIIGIAGIFRNETLTPGQRILWLAGFLFFSWLAGFLWYLQVVRPLQKKEKANKENQK